jgi:hypothetical protein
LTATPAITDDPGVRGRVGVYGDERGDCLLAAHLVAPTMSVVSHCGVRELWVPEVGGRRSGKRAGAGVSTS